MHVLMLCKRQYTGQDLLDDQYGRLYELPEGLARLSIQISGIALSYRPRPAVEHLSLCGVQWQSINAIPKGPFRLPGYIQDVHQRNPVDIVLAASDAPCCILGMKIAKRLAVPCVLDLYDNYESFGLTRIPGLKAAFRNACRSADGISTVTHALADHVRETIDPRGPVQVIANAVRTDIFHTMDKLDCRRSLGLPTTSRLIGCAGAIDQSRGISDMFQAFHQLAERDADLHLVIAGRRSGTAARFNHPRLLDLGMLDWQRVPILLNALDVAITCNRSSSFGRYCYPLKLAESLACRIPVVTANVGDAVAMVQNETACLYTPGDAEGLAAAISGQLSAPKHPSLTGISDWQDRAAVLADLLELAVQSAGVTH
ncbi:glycosyltransferase family 4 protein [Stenotrophomonas maltophilia]|uniref:Glycosyl transferase group 1 n=1 Tax=Stenotrophomonas maltophilia (strain R551-3) TaxID=391008 RepID=B4ST81_STRM5|nr:glycosyltransferase family 4 protein [Stenotrophomonas maltophilia]ACF52872.1 glycosyl transferase group 1 [Stenotrophomonas maltophilia R551-3]